MSTELQQLEAKLKAPINFPSPPGVAQRIIEIANDPDATIARVAETISNDPGLTARILRTANSPLYAQRRRSENLRQALVVLGLNAAMTLALSFSLVAAFKSGRSKGLDYPRYWRRALMCALTARALGEQLKLNAGENLFLASLLQDIAVAAIDRIKPDFYAELPRMATHRQMCEYEVGRLGADHARVAAWLLKSWKLPEQLCSAIELSHQPKKAQRKTPAGDFARCVACASEIVEVFLQPDSKDAMAGLAALVDEVLGMSGAQLGEVLATITRTMPEVEQLFDTSLLDAEATAAIMEHAHELLALRSLESLQQVSALRKTTEDLEARTEALADQGRRDALTGVFNRGFLDQHLKDEFGNAVRGSWPLSVVFADLDHFKRINDTHGHAAGDAVLRATAALITGAVRDNDLVGRYGGEEFVVVLPGVAQQEALVVCERILRALRGARHEFGGAAIVATASLGLATHDGLASFADAGKLVEAADRAVYAAKRAGRDRLAVSSSGGGEPVAHTG